MKACAHPRHLIGAVTGAAAGLAPVWSRGPHGAADVRRRGLPGPGSNRVGGWLAAVAAGLALMCLPACKPTAKPPTTQAKTNTLAAGIKTNAPATQTNDAEQFVSVFDEWLPPDKAKDPFFPKSTRRLKQIPKETQDTNTVHLPPEPILVLKGVYGGRAATINNVGLDLHEKRAVRIPSGKVVVELLEVGDNYAIVRVGEEPGVKRLTLQPYKSSHENH